MADARPPVHPLWLLVIFTTVVAIRGLFVPGLVASDDSQYIDGAMRLAAGEAPGVLDHVYVRFPFVLWLASWLKLGLAPAQLWIPQLVVEGLTGTALFVFATRFIDPGGAGLAVLIWAMMPVLMVHGSIVLSDELALGFSLAGATAVIEGVRRDTPSWKLVIAGGVLLGLAGVTKEPFGLVAPLLSAWILLASTYRIKAWRHALVLAVVAVLTFLLITYPVLWIWTGDWQYRQHALAQVYGESGSQQFRVAFGWTGLSYYLTRVVLNPLWGGALGTLALAVTLGGSRGASDRWLLLGWVLLFFLFFQFGSTDWRHYNRVPQQPRYVTLIVVPMIVILGGWLWRIMVTGMLGRIGVATLLLATAWQNLRTARTIMGGSVFWQSIPLALGAAKPLISHSGSDRMVLPRAAVALLPRFIRSTVAPRDSASLCQLLGSPPAGDAVVLLPYPWNERHGCDVNGSWFVERLEGPATVLDQAIRSGPVPPLRRRALMKDVGVVALPRAPVIPEGARR